jgi:hypothetical protein
LGLCFHTLFLSFSISYFLPDIFCMIVLWWWDDWLKCKYHLSSIIIKRYLTASWRSIDDDYLTIKRQLSYDYLTEKIVSMHRRRRLIIILYHICYVGFRIILSIILFQTILVEKYHSSKSFLPFGMIEHNSFSLVCGNIVGWWYIDTFNIPVVVVVVFWKDVSC